jgi:hypothetical protein
MGWWRAVAAILRRGVLGRGSWRSSFIEFYFDVSNMGWWSCGMTAVLRTILRAILLRWRPWGSWCGVSDGKLAQVGGWEGSTDCDAAHEKEERGGSEWELHGEGLDENKCLDMS